jgi:predicted DNA-binding transcriptional regulator AlpA
MTINSGFLGVIPRGLRRREAARYVGVSPSKFDEMVRDGRMPAPFHIDRCTIWDILDLDPAIDALKDRESRNPWDKGVAT